MQYSIEILETFFLYYFGEVKTISLLRIKFSLIMIKTNNVSREEWRISNSLH